MKPTRQNGKRIEDHPHLARLDPALGDGADGTAVDIKPPR
jgi:hypothetical protein